jgi:hypothetical protein
MIWRSRAEHLALANNTPGKPSDAASKGIGNKEARLGTPILCLPNPGWTLLLSSLVPFSSEPRLLNFVSGWQ